MVSVTGFGFPCKFLENFGTLMAIWKMPGVKFIVHVVEEI